MQYVSQVIFTIVDIETSSIRSHGRTQFRLWYLRQQIQNRGPLEIAQEAAHANRLSTTTTQVHTTQKDVQTNTEIVRVQRMRQTIHQSGTASQSYAVIFFYSFYKIQLIFSLIFLSWNFV